MASLLKMIASAWAGSRFQPVSAALGPDTWAGVPGRFRFGMPWPWEEYGQSGTIVDVTGQGTSVEPLLTVWAPRTSGTPAVFVLWRSEEPESLDAVMTAPGQEFARLYRGQARGVRKILLRGSRAIVVEVQTSAGERVQRLMVDWGGYLLHGEYRVPAAYADAYGPHFETMLATWEWA